MLEGMESNPMLATPAGPVVAAAGGPRGAGARLPARVYLWRRALVLAVLVCLLWASLWGVFRLGELVGAHLVAPAVGTAPVPVVDATAPAPVIDGTAPVPVVDGPQGES